MLITYTYLPVKASYILSLVVRFWTCCQWNTLLRQALITRSHCARLPIIVTCSGSFLSTRIGEIIITIHFIFYCGCHVNGIVFFYPFNPDTGGDGFVVEACETWGIWKTIRIRAKTSIIGTALCLNTVLFNILQPQQEWDADRIGHAEKIVLETNVNIVSGIEP